ncbi:MAG: glycosyltransferase family 2 protein [Ruminococcaceae bacterium]|nr:glycosyltransferase family 2 protein [Oscillospiraceae bacterium]
MPKVSVLMGAYNCAEYVEEAIDSVLNQTFKDFEFIIVNDGSSDNTAEIVKEFEIKDDRIVFIENDRNHGLAYTLNHGLEYVKGEFIIRMDGDDISKPNRFERLLEAMDENPDYDVIGSACDLFDKTGVWGEVSLNYKPNKLDAFYAMTVSHATVIMKTESLRAVGGYDIETDKARAEDYDLWCRMVLNGYKLMSIPDKIYQVRWDRDNYYSRRPFKTKLETARLIKRWHRQMGFGPKEYLAVIRTYMKAFIPSFAMKIYHKHKLQK